MDVTMADLNKNVNSVINRACSSGETVTILKHGKPIATILPIADHSAVDDAVQYLKMLEPAAVSESVESVIGLGRQRGI
jgi:prevent-host-death family protein